MSEQYLTRLLCAEPLESRELLSGLPPSSSIPPPTAISTRAVVEIIEIGSADEEEDEEETVVAPSDLPPAVRAALEAEFPGADLVEAEFSIDEGEPEFGVAARVEGRLYDITLTPSGTIIEVEEEIATRALPQPILDWVRRQYPGADIDEAVVMDEQGVISYELVIAGDDGDGADVEAVLQLQEAPASTPLPPPFDAAPSETASPPRLLAAVAADGSAALPPSPDAPRTDAAPPADDAASETAPSDAALDAATAAALFAAVPVTVASDEQPIALLEALPLLIAISQDAFTDWLPQLADVLDEGALFDPAAIERAVQDIVRQLDAIAQAATDALVESDGPAGPAFRFAAIVALIVGAHLLRLDTRLRAAALNWCFPLPPRDARTTAASRWRRRLTAGRPWHAFWYR